MQKKIDSRIANNPTFETVKIKTEFNLGVLKTIIVALIILAQFVLLVVTGIHLTNVFKWLVIFSLVISIIFCIIELSSKQTGQTKATWILLMLITPTFGWILFLLSNEKVLFTFKKKKYQKIYNSSNILSGDVDCNNLSTDIKNDCKYLENYGKFPTFSASHLKYFSTGASLYDNIIEDLKNAEKFIFLEYYIVSDGILLNRILDILEEKAKSGVDIRLIYDDMGSHGTLKYRTKKRMKKVGIKLHTFNKLVPLFNLALNLRDHRKIIVIDGKIAYTGGANLSDEYINEKRSHGYWKDSGIRLTGKCVSTFTLSILRQWEFLTNKHEDYRKYLDIYDNSSTLKEENRICVPYVTGPDYEQKIAKDVYENLIANAKEKLYIMTPYFIPDETILGLLKNKAQCGVDVHIILPEIPDKSFVYLITLDNAETLMKYGVHVHIMKNSFVHNKVVLSENACVVGSINMDQRSFYQQFESAVYTNDSSVMEEVLADFNKCISRSNPHTIKKKGLIKTSLIYILRLVSPLM